MSERPKDTEDKSPSRRDWLVKGAGSIGAVTAGGALFAQQAATPSGSAAAAMKGRMMRAFVRKPQGASVETVKLSALRDDMIAIQTEATQCC